jgi:hypothetical protein
MDLPDVFDDYPSTIENLIDNSLDFLFDRSGVSVKASISSGNGFGNTAPVLNIDLRYFNHIFEFQIE